MKILEAIRRMFTLPKAYNSISDIAHDPRGAINHARKILLQVQTWAEMLGRRDVVARTKRILELLEELEDWLSPVN